MNRFIALKSLFHIGSTTGNRRPWLTLFLLLVGITVGTTTAQATQFPYVAYVTGEQTYVRSGPGQRYYPTSQIAEGYAVEVYRHDANGWCAIRPPKGSFSWVPSHHTLPITGDVVEIIADQVVAHVGSTLSPDRNAVQVLLPKGERLQRLPATESDDPRWVRVTAPAGEFRWIAASKLSLQPPLETQPLPKTNESGWTKQSERSADTSNEPNAFHHLNAPYHRNKGAATDQTGLPFASPSITPSQTPEPPQTTNSNDIKIVAGSPAELQLAQFQSKPSELAPPALLNSENLPPRVSFGGSTTVVRAESVEELELRLSQAVVKTPQQWQLAPLEAEASRLLQETKSPAVRAQLRELAQRITRFQQVQQRYTNPPPVVVAAKNEPTSETASETMPEPNPDLPVVESYELTGSVSTIRERVQKDFSANSETPNADKPLYDATGLLKPVVSKRKNAPEYALINPQGKVVSFVTPTSDLDLKPYIGQQVGVHGTRGFMPEYRRTHVTAGRITPIKATVRR